MRNTKKGYINNYMGYYLNMIIRIKDLTKYYGKTKALQNINLEIKENETFGILGPNGAGKTTLISILTTILKPTSGTIFIGNYEISKKPNEIRKNIGVIFQEPSLDLDLTAYDNLYFHSKLYKIKNFKREIKKFLHLVDLWDKRDTTVNKFSGGMKRRLEIARGLLHKPKILFLDEPTLGLDPQMRYKIWEYIKKLKYITIILTTHYMEEADKLCDRVAIINNGEIVVKDYTRKLKEVIKGDIIGIKTNNQKLIQILKKKGYIKNITEKNGIIQLTVKEGKLKIPKIIELANKNKIKIDSVNLHEPTLDDVFLHYVGKTINEKEMNYKEEIKFRMKR